MALLLVVGGCASDAEPEAELLVVDGGLTITALTDVIISTTPLGDSGIGAFGPGMRATATCFVPEASTNTGARERSQPIPAESRSP